VELPPGRRTADRERAEALATRYGLRSPLERLLKALPLLGGG
jgi:hypothetical protein